MLVDHDYDATDDEIEAWNAAVSHEVVTCLDAATRQGKTTALVLAPADAEIRRVEWPASPLRVFRCLGRADAMSLLDATDDDGSPIGRLRHQDEYLEWRLVRRGDRVGAIEVTTELPEAWELLAGSSPWRVLEVVGGFARRAELPTRDVFGELDPFLEAATAEDRVRAFRSIMLGYEGRPSSPRGPIGGCNSGVDAISCMIHPSNTLGALVRLIVDAARPLLIRDELTGRPRFPSGSEAIGAGAVRGTQGRYSDPLLVERIVRWASESREIGLDEPAGVYVRDVQRHELELPDGTEVPQEWFTWSRRLGGDVAGRAPRYQRLRLEVPADVDLDVSELVVGRTGERLRFGGQFVELVQVGLDLRVGPPRGLVDLDPVEAEIPAPDCSEELRSWRSFTGVAP